MRRPSYGPRFRRLLRVVVGVFLVALLLGCTYAAEEPGLFDRPTPTAVSTPSTPPPVPDTNPALPVLGEAVWTSADGLDVQVRIGIHGVRRIVGGTVLDWSVTPLAVPNLQVGDPVPASLDLALSRPEDELPLIYLVDLAAGELYRPLVSPADSTRCVCTPLSLAQSRLAVGHTTLLQVAYPTLPTALSTIDVTFASVPPFWQVPITSIDHLPTAGRRAQLGRPGAELPSAGFTDMFRHGPVEQVFRLQTHRVLASNTFTTLEWTIWSVTGGAGLDAATSPPLAESGAGRQDTEPASASGPVLVVSTEAGRQTLRPRLARADVGDPGAVECLCSPLRGWTSLLRRPDKPATVVTTYPPMPEGVQRVQVRFSGLGVLAVPVTSAPDARRRSGRALRWTPTTWRSDQLRAGADWSTFDWPTPIPAAAELPESGAHSTVVR